MSDTDDEPVVTPEQAVWAEGPWEHRDVAANGARFHIATMGDGPLVVLMHGFPQYWWTWRHLLPRLAEAGYRAVAMDLRGYGGSDHTPHGYDPHTLSADVAGVVRSLGESSAVMIGHGWGGMIAWAAAVMRLSAVRAIVPVSMPHPILLRRGIVSDPEQRKLSRYAINYQWPLAPERALTKNNAARVEVLLQRWSATPQWPSPAGGGDVSRRDPVQFHRALRAGSTTGGRSGRSPAPMGAGSSSAWSSRSANRSCRSTA